MAVARGILREEADGLARLELRGLIAFFCCLRSRRTRDFHHQLIQRVMIAAPQRQRIPRHAALHLALHARGLRQPLKLLLLVGILCLQEGALALKNGDGTLSHKNYSSFVIHHSSFIKRCEGIIVGRCAGELTLVEAHEGDVSAEAECHVRLAVDGLMEDVFHALFLQRQP